MDKFLGSIVSWLFRLVGKEAEQSKVDAVTQFLKFCIVGASNTLLSYAINVGVLFLLKDRNVSWDYVAGNMVAFILSVLWSFYWNNRFVFKNSNQEKGAWVKKLIKTYISYGVTGIVLTNILSYVWINIFHISKYIAPLMNLIISVPINFLLNKFWAFK